MTKFYYDETNSFGMLTIIQEIRFGSLLHKPLEIKSQEMFDKKLDYIHQNPVHAGFVTKEEDWKYSSARDFCGMKGLIELSYS